MSGRLAEAIASVGATFPLWRAAGDRLGLAAAHESRAIFGYYSAQRRQAEADAERAAELAAASSDIQYAGARATRGYLAFQCSDLPLANACFVEARRIAEEEDSDDLVLRGALLQAAADLAAEDPSAELRLLTAIHDEIGRAHV